MLERWWLDLAVDQSNVTFPEQPPHLKSESCTVRQTQMIFFFSVISRKYVTVISRKCQIFQRETEIEKPSF